MVLKNRQLYRFFLLKIFYRNLIKCQIYIYNPQGLAEKDLFLFAKIE